MWQGVVLVETVPADQCPVALSWLRALALAFPLCPPFRGGLVATPPLSTEACHFAIDELKATVPIWKREVYADGSTWKANCDCRWGTGASSVIGRS